MEEAGAKDPHGKAEEGGWRERGTEQWIYKRSGRLDRDNKTRA